MAVSILPSGAKNNGKIVSDYFAVLAIILPYLGKSKLFHLNVNVAVYFAQMLKIFARTMANFSALGMRPHPLHPHAVCLSCLVKVSKCCVYFAS